VPDLNAFLAGGGEMAERIRAAKWESSALGPLQGWPQSLRSALSICLRSSTATAIFWGPDHLFLYNDSWAALLGDRHPGSLGCPARQVMADIWPALEDQFRRALQEAESVSLVDAKLPRNLNGVSFDSYWSYTLLPIAGEDGTIGGLLGQARETTESVLRRRRDALMLRLAGRLRLLSEPDALVDAALELVAEEVVVDRIGYAEIDHQAAAIDILRCLVRGDTADASGRYRLYDAGNAMQDPMREGRSIRIEEMASAPGVDDRTREAYAQADVAAVLAAPIVSGEAWRAMIFAHDSKPRRWLDHEEILLRSATEMLWREVSRARAEAGLRRSEQRFRRIFEQANDIILTADLDQVLTDINPAAAAAMEAPRDEIVGRSMHDFLTPAGTEQAREMLRRKLDAGEPTTWHTLEVISRSGRVMEWEINSTLTLDDSGRPVGLHAIARDVTERRQAEARQRLLVNELNHRVKNTLALIQGLALQSFKDGRDPADAREAFQQRLAALAAAHDLLTRESWEGATLDELVGEAVGHLNTQEPRIEASGPPVTLGPKAAVSLVMALHELATNAAKYGALSVPGGHVGVRWEVESDRLVLDWRERGGPEVRAPERRGFGLRMIERALKADLAGGATMSFEPAGLVCRIEASLGMAGPDGSGAG
jgi:PAS domain S-box-containing protein